MEVEVQIAAGRLHHVALDVVDTAHPHRGGGLRIFDLLADDLLALPPIPMARSLEWVGFSMMTVGIGLLIVSLGLFRAYGENPEPWTPSQAIIARGPYRHSRNPMYLGFLLLLAAFACYLQSILALPLLPLFVLYMNRFQIMPEERFLLQKFGADYQAYLTQVQRWF